MLFKRNVATQNEATKKLQAFDAAVHSTAQGLYNGAVKLAADLETEFGVNRASALQSILMRLRDYDNGLFTDGRAAVWYGRIRLYDAARPGEVIADSDHMRDPREPGSTSHISLPALVAWAVDYVATQSNGIPTGLDRPILERRLRSFRTQLSSRKDGTGVLTLEYVSENKDMIARIDIQRQAQTAKREAESAVSRLSAKLEKRRN